MAQITKTVDKTLVHGSEIFIYTINVSYSGLTQPAQEGILTDFFPSKIVYALPQIGGQIKGITQTPVPGGTNVTFDFGAVDAGTSLSFTVACFFGPGRVDNDSFTNVGLLFADGVQVATGTAPTVNLILTPNFVLAKSLVNPGPVNPNEDIMFTINLNNVGDLGAAINNIVITDILPPQLIADTTFLPIGVDIPVNGYSDPTYSGLRGSWSGGNTLNFTLPSYHGGDYQITFRAKVAPDVTPGEIITNTANWTIDGVSQTSASAMIVVFSEATQFNLIKQGPVSGVVGSPITYTIRNSNQGTTALTDYLIDDPIPAQVDITALQFSSLTVGIPTYSISIATSDNPTVFKPVVTNVTGNTPLTDLTPFIPAGTRVTEIKLTAPTIQAANSNHLLTLFGTINNVPAPGNNIVNTVVASATGAMATSSWQTSLTGSSDLNIIKGIIPIQPAYFPLENFQFVLTARPLNTITVNPILSDLLPNGIIYVEGSEYFQFTDAETGITYDSRQPNFPVPLPTREIINNFGGTGRTLIRWSFNNYIQGQNDSLSIFFTCFVEINPPTSFTNNAYEGNPGDNVAFVYNPIPDTLDYDGDGITDENLSSSEVSGVILTSSEFLLEKQVKGATDLAFSSAGTTVPGGSVTYHLTVTNNQPTQLKNINIVDILPYVGDTGVILVNIPRDSQFNVYATAVVTAQIINLIGNPVDPNPDITILYSTSTDPMRFDQFGNPIGTGTFSTTPPSDITTLAAIQVLTGPNVILNPYDQLIVTINGVAPVGAPLNETAYNSFAVMADQILADGEIQPLLPTEPNKVGVTIVGGTNGSIGQFVWLDQNGNGIFDPGEPGVNGVTVQLYDANMNLLETTVTANNASNQPGYYLFSNLPVGNYFVKFLPSSPYTLTQQEAGVPNGSTPNPATGLTNVIALAAGQNIITINAGLLSPCAPPVINASNKCVQVGSTFNPLTGVTATDCQGNNITSSIIVIENTVNTAIAGTYFVTYLVTDSLGQTTRKTITVVVCATRPRVQAISDAVESVALEQTALSHILNAEGEKLQAVVAMPNATTDQILAVNKSVQSMIDTISNFELILQGKLEVFDCGLCTNDCCGALSSGIDATTSATNCTSCKR